MEDPISQAWSFYDSLGPNVPRPIDILTPQQARDKVDPVRHRLFDSWYRLKQIVLAHEDTIQKRWKKRTGAKRKQLLQGVDPMLPKEHAPEIAAFASHYRSPQESNLNKKDFVLPYLNLEDLSINNGTQFLGLLHTRAHHFPSEFAWFDDDMLHFGIVAKGIRRYHAVDCAMVSFGDENTYGRVLEYSEPLDRLDKDSPDGFQMEHLLRESLSFGDGLVVLETQSKLVDFLLVVVSKILVDLDLANLSSSAPLPGPVIPILNTEFQWKSIARANTLRPYGPPPAFAIDDLAALFESQYELALQHLVDLRTDPMYLSENLQSYYAHRIETVAGQAPQLLIQNRAMALMLMDAYASFTYYHVGKEVVEQFRLVQRKFPNGPMRARDLPEEYENALMSFHPVLSLLEARITKLHNQTIYSSEAMRSGFEVRGTDSKFEKHEMRMTRQSKDHLYTYLSLLLQEDQAHLWQPARIFDQIDRITEDPIQHRRISPLLAALLSQWGVINDCKAILAWHRPAVENSETIPVGVQKRLKKWEPLLLPIALDAKVGLDTSLARKAFPVSQFAYPKGPRNADWARGCQTADDNFAAFWKAADPWLAEACGKPLLALTTSVVEPFVVVPPDWAVLVKLPAPPKRRITSVEATLPFGDAPQSSANTEPSPAPKAKTKTRGIAAIRTEQETTLTEEPVKVTAPTPVSAKTYKVLSTLFTAAQDEQIALQQSAVPWKDIQAAFASLDFTLDKSRGSAWTFRHPDGQRVITVHEPHPEPTMRFWEVRRFGRRLRQRFEWTLHSFALEETRK